MRSTHLNERVNTMMKQSDAVVLAVRATFTEGVVPTTGWTTEQKQSVYNALLQSFKAGQWMKESGGTDDGAVLKYIPGLVNNHVRKDTRLNGGTKYVAKNPGSRSGSSDESVRAMRELLRVTTDVVGKQQIEAAIAARLEELKPKVEINVGAIPESLRHLVK